VSETASAVNASHYLIMAEGANGWRVKSQWKRSLHLIARAAGRAAADQPMPSVVPRCPGSGTIPRVVDSTALPARGFRAAAIADFLAREV
jgi:hypothetical protein